MDVRDPVVQSRQSFCLARRFTRHDTSHRKPLNVEHQTQTHRILRIIPHESPPNSLLNGVLKAVYIVAYRLVTGADKTPPVDRVSVIGGD